MFWLGLQFYDALASAVDFLDEGVRQGVRVANWAHLGGFIEGMIIVLLLPEGAEPYERDSSAYR